MLHKASEILPDLLNPAKGHAQGWECSEGSCICIHCICNSVLKDSTALDRIFQVLSFDAGLLGPI